MKDLWVCCECFCEWVHVGTQNRTCDLWLSRVGFVAVCGGWQAKSSGCDVENGWCDGAVVSVVNIFFGNGYLRMCFKLWMVLGNGCVFHLLHTLLNFKNLVDDLLEGSTKVSQHFITPIFNKLSPKPCIATHFFRVVNVVTHTSTTIVGIFHQRSRKVWNPDTNLTQEVFW